MTTSVSAEIEKEVAASAGVRASIADGKELPILDVGPYLAGAPGALEQLAADVKWIQENLGFFAIINHGIPQALIDESFRQTAKLFEIPMEEKVRHRVGYHHQGYLPPKASILKSTAIAEKIAVNTKKDTNAAWLFMRNRTAEDPKVRSEERRAGKECRL